MCTEVSCVKASYDLTKLGWLSLALRVGECGGGGGDSVAAAVVLVMNADVAFDQGSTTATSSSLH